MTSPDDAVKSTLVTYFARGCMIAATLVGLPLAGAMLSRVIAQSDAVAATLQQQTTDIKLLSQGVKQTLDAHVSQLTDHELRLRQIERK